MKRFRKILHPTDFSKVSGAAFKKAVELARQERAALRLVHVLAPPAVLLEDSFMTAKTWAELTTAGRREAQRRLAPLLAKARKARVRASAAVLEGMVFEEIVREARRRRADLIVMGTHGRTGVARFFLGSVAARVLALARCPVLTVR
ncbi:MAG: universal stress protein [Candidatus Rokubacteria bacterium]|nr:universal stress protein [Candidatus Rokubacteria bacterium]